MLPAHPPPPKKQLQRRSHPSMELPALDPVLQELQGDEKTSSLVKFVLHSLILFMKQAAQAQNDVEVKLKYVLEQQKAFTPELGSVLSRQASGKDQKHHISGETYSDPLSPRPIDVRLEQEDKRWEEFAKKQIAMLVSAELPQIQQKFIEKHGCLQNPLHPRPKKVKKPKNALQSSSKVQESTETPQPPPKKPLKPQTPANTGGPQTWGVLPSVSDEERPDTNTTETHGIRVVVDDIRHTVDGLTRDMASVGEDGARVEEGLRRVEEGIEELRQRVKGVEIEAEREVVWGRFFSEIAARVDEAENKIRKVERETGWIATDRVKKLLDLASEEGITNILRQSGGSLYSQADSRYQEVMLTEIPKKQSTKQLIPSKNHEEALALIKEAIQDLNTQFEALKLEKREKYSAIEHLVQTKVLEAKVETSAAVDKVKREVDRLQEKTRDSVAELVNELKDLGQAQIKLQTDVEDLVNKQAQVFGSNQNIVTELIARSEELNSRLSETEQNVFVLSKEKYLPQVEPKEADHGKADESGAGEKDDTNASTVVTVDVLNSYLADFDISLRRKADLFEAQSAIDSVWKRINHYLAVMEMRLNSRLENFGSEVLNIQQHLTRRGTGRKIGGRANWQSRPGESRSVADQSKASVEMEEGPLSKSKADTEQSRENAHKIRYPGSKLSDNFSIQKRIPKVR